MVVRPLASPSLGKPGDASRRGGATDMLAGGGEMGALIRAYDWSASVLGAPGGWPQSLRMAVRLMLSSQHPMFIWWGPELIQFYNDAYRQTMGPERHPQALGQPGRECWGEIWEIIGPQIEQVMSGGGATWHEDHLVPVTRHGRREEVWWTYGYSPIDDDNQPGGIGGVLVICNDVTRQHETLEALRHSEERTRMALGAAGGIGTWDWDIAADRVMTDGRLAALFGLPREQAERGRPLADYVARVHPDDKAAVRAALRAAIASGADYAQDFRVLRPDGSIRWISAQGRCYGGAAGQPQRFPGVVLDITERKAAEQVLTGLLAEKDRLAEQNELVAREMSHRIMNSFQLLQSVLTMQTRNITDPAARQVVGQGVARIQAMAVVHRRLFEATQDEVTIVELGGYLKGLVEELVAAFNSTDRCQLAMEMSAASLPTGKASTLGLITTELVLNAMKHAFSDRDRGRLDVRFAAHGDGYRLSVADTGPGLPDGLDLATAPGLGMKLVRSLTRQLKGQLEIDSRPSGTCFTVTFPA